MYKNANQGLADLSSPQHFTCISETLPPFKTFHNSEKKIQSVVLRQLSGFPQQIFGSVREKPGKVSPVWGAVSQHVYTDAVPLMANVLTYTPSNGVLVSIKTGHVQGKVWTKLLLFQDLRAAKDEKEKKKGLRWCGAEIYGCMFTETPLREPDKRFLACLGRIRCGKGGRMNSLFHWSVLQWRPQTEWTSC